MGNQGEDQGKEDRGREVGGERQWEKEEGERGVREGSIRLSPISRIPQPLFPTSSPPPSYSFTFLLSLYSWGWRG